MKSPLTNSRVMTTIAVHDMQNAMDFYGEVLGLKEVGRNVGGMVYESDGGRLAIYQSVTAGTSQATIAWWTVDDVHAAVKDLKKRGVTFCENYDLPYAKRKGDVYLLNDEREAAWFIDPDGNILGIGNF